MKMVNLTINGIPVEVPEGSTILEAAQKAGIRIPTLCYLKDINAIGACRMCVVEVKGARAWAAACVYPVNEGMEVYTNSPEPFSAQGYSYRPPCPRLRGTRRRRPTRGRP